MSLQRVASRSQLLGKNAGWTAKVVQAFPVWIQGPMFLLLASTYLELPGGICIAFPIDISSGIDLYNLQMDEDLLGADRTMPGDIDWSWLRHSCRCASCRPTEDMSL